MRSLLPLYFAATLLVLHGCESVPEHGPTAGTPVVESAGAAYYAEETHRGRVYVIGKPKTHEAFKQTNEIPVSVTLVGAGAGGITIVIEADAKDPSLERRLREAYAKRNGVSLD